MEDEVILISEVKNTVENVRVNRDTANEILQTETNDNESQIREENNIEEIEGLKNVSEVPSLPKKQ